MSREQRVSSLLLSQVGKKHKFLANKVTVLSCGRPVQLTPGLFLLGQAGGKCSPALQSKGPENPCPKDICDSFFSPHP